MDWIQTLTIIITISAIVIGVNAITTRSLNKRIDDVNKRIDDLREIVLTIMNHLLPPAERKKKK